MRLVWVGISVLAACLALFWVIDLSAVMQWAVEQQRSFQNQMAGAVRALKAGDASAYLTLFAATGAYGFVHALGPGHGKYLVGGVGLGTSVSTSRLVRIAVASSLVQALWAILLVYGGFSLIALTASQMTFLAEDVLAPVSYLAIAAVGLMLVWRGVRRMLKSGKTHHHHDHDHHHDCSGCNHGPTPQDVEKATTWRETLALITSVAVRPCTGAIFLLVIAWQMDILIAGALAVVVMGFGTAALTSLVALSSVTARKLALVSVSDNGAQATFFYATQIFVGITIMWLSLGLLRFTM